MNRGLLKLGPQNIRGLRGEATATAWKIPPDMTAEEWLVSGLVLSRMERGHQWWLGDWWSFLDHNPGSRKAMVSSEEWKSAGGLAFQTCANYGHVSFRFRDTSRRREALQFRHHSEVAMLEPDRADGLLDWCEETIHEKGRPRTTKELRLRVNMQSNQIGQPSDQTCRTNDLAELVREGRRYGCFYIDPPWLYDNQGTRAATGNHYGGMTVDELCGLPVADLSLPDAHLHLWITNAFLFEAPKLFEAWGFEFKSSFVWVKSSIGIGNYWRNSHEILLTAIRGDAKRFSDHSLPSWLECARGVHSGKPEQVAIMLEKASPPPFIELFARGERKGWTVWGNEIGRSLLFPEGERNNGTAAARSNS